MTTIAAPLNPVEQLQQHFAEGVVNVREFRGETTVIVTPAALPNIMQYLRDTAGLIYNYLSDISAVDYWEPYGGYGERHETYGGDNAALYSPDPTKPGSETQSGHIERPERFAVSYHIYSLLYNRRLRIKVFVNEDEPVVPTVTNVWPAANWLEREINDMMGIRFEGHPDMRRLLMPDDWQGHPHRRDYPLGYETIQFSFNVEDILKHKPFAKGE